MGAAGKPPEMDTIWTPESCQGDESANARQCVLPELLRKSHIFPFSTQALPSEPQITPFLQPVLSKLFPFYFCFSHNLLQPVCIHSLPEQTRTRRH